MKLLTTAAAALAALTLAAPAKAWTYDERYAIGAVAEAVCMVRGGESSNAMAVEAVNYALRVGGISWKDVESPALSREINRITSIRCPNR